jgi:hypothetical protein
MEWKFTCPGCHSILNPNQRVVFKVEYGGRKALMLLSAHLGDYLSICDDEFASGIETGSLVKFSCPICDRDLSAADNERFAEILQVTPEREPRRVRFSQVYGEHATFTIAGDEIESYGKDAARFRDLDFSDTDSWW